MVTRLKLQSSHNTEELRSLFLPRQVSAECMCMQNEKRVRLSLMVYESGIHSYIIRNKKKKVQG